MAITTAAAGVANAVISGGGLQEVGRAAKEERLWARGRRDGLVGVASLGGRSSALRCVKFEVVLRRGRVGSAIAAAHGHVAAVSSVVQGEGEKQQAVPLPVVNIDQHTDPDATIVEMSFGDRLGALLDTTKALKNLGLNVVKAQVSTDSSRGMNKFYITRSDNGNKVEQPELLESIRLTIINNLLQYHPESSEQLSLGGVFGGSAPKQKIDIDVATHVTVKKVDDKQSLLIVETADRPGLLLDITKVITEISIKVESADINTEGLVAKDQFYVSYGGKALSKSLEEVVVNCLRYYIRKADCDDDSY